jgi:hypothetical protein
MKLVYMMLSELCVACTTILETLKLDLSIGLHLRGGVGEGWSQGVVFHHHSVATVSLLLDKQNVLVAALKHSASYGPELPVEFKLRCDSREHEGKGAYGTNNIPAPGTRHSYALVGRSLTPLLH